MLRLATGCRCAPPSSRPADLDVASKISREQEAVGTEYLVDRVNVPALLVSQVSLQAERLRFERSRSLPGQCGILVGPMQEQLRILHETETCRPEGTVAALRLQGVAPRAGGSQDACSPSEGCASSTGMVLTTGEKPWVSAFKAQTLMEQSWQPAKRKLPAAARARMVPCRGGTI